MVTSLWHLGLKGGVTGEDFGVGRIVGQQVFYVGEVTGQIPQFAVNDGIAVDEQVIADVQHLGLAKVGNQIAVGVTDFFRQGRQHDGFAIEMQSGAGVKGDARAACLS